MSVDGFVADPGDGVQELLGAGDRVVSVARGCLAAGLLDEIWVNLIPVVLGTGIPFLADVANAPVRLEDPDVTEAAGVTHLRYRVRA